MNKPVRREEHPLDRDLSEQEQKKILANLDEVLKPHYRPNFILSGQLTPEETWALYQAKSKQYIIEDFSNERTRVHYEAVIRGFGRFMWNHRQLTPFDATATDLQKWRGILEAAGQDHSTIENKTSVMSAFYEWLKKPGVDGQPALLRDNPVTAISNRVKIDKFEGGRKISREMLSKIIENIDRSDLRGKRDYCLIYGYFITGRRASEWNAVRFKDIEWDSRPLYFNFVRKGQKRTRDEIPAILEQPLLEYLEARWGKNFRRTVKPDQYLFTALNKENVPNKPITYRAILKMVKKLYLKAGGTQLSQIGVHSFRHSHSQGYQELGAPVQEIQMRLKHSDSKTTDIYLSQGKKEANPRAENLDRWLKGLPPLEEG